MKLPIKGRLLGVLLVGLGWLWLGTGEIWANPYFYLEGSTSATTGNNVTYTVRLDTDGNDVTAIQAVVDIEAGYFNYVSNSISGSDCSLWSLQNPGTPPSGTNQQTPYYYNNMMVMSCGFTGGINQSDAVIARFTLNGYTAGTATLSFNTTYSLIDFLGTPFSLGAMADTDVVLSGSSTTPTPTPTGTITPSPTPTGPTSTPTPTSTATPTPTITPTPTPTSTTTTTTTDTGGADGYDLTKDDLNLKTIDGNTGTANTTTTEAANSEIGEAEIVDEDNTVPDPPEITPRPPATPFPTPGPGGGFSEGEVLAVQSIRELLVPGKSDADRTVVLFNFLSILTLICIIAVIAWRLVMTRRGQAIKKAHLTELLSGELATIESKLNVVDDPEEVESLKREFGDSVEHILEEIKKS